MSEQDIRWIQRFNRFVKALAQLREAVELAQQRPLVVAIMEQYFPLYVQLYHTLLDLQGEG